MEKIPEIARDCIREAAHDYVGLWVIAGAIRFECKVTENERVKRLSLDVVRRVIDGGLGPGDYLKTGFRFWPELDKDAIISRIEREWDAARGDPTLADPICWFASRDAQRS